MVLNFLTFPDKETHEFIEQCLEKITFCETSRDEIEKAAGKGELTYLAGTIFHYAPEFLYEPRYVQACSIMAELSIWFKLFQPSAYTNYKGKSIFDTTLAYGILKKLRTQDSYSLTQSIDVAAWGNLLGCYVLHYLCYYTAETLSIQYGRNITLNQAKLYELQQTSYLHQTKCSHYEVPIISNVLDSSDPAGFTRFYNNLPKLTPTKFHTYLRLYCLEETLLSKSHIDLVDEDMYQVSVRYLGNPDILDLQAKLSTICTLYFDSSTNVVLLKSNPKAKTFLRKTKVIHALG